MGREAAGRNLLRVFSMGGRRRSCPKIGWPFAAHPKLGQKLVLASRKTMFCLIVFVCVFFGFNSARTWRERVPAECAAEQEGFRMVKSSVTTR